MLQREAPGGQAGTSSRIENYLGFPSGVSGDELASRALQQARRLGAEILVTRSVARLDAATRQIYLDGDDIVRGRTIILATGVTWRRLKFQTYQLSSVNYHLLPVFYKDRKYCCAIISLGGVVRKFFILISWRMFKHKPSFGVQ
jgi:thioredoxin reductase